MYIITPSNINKNIDDIRNKLNQNIKDETFFNTVNKKGMLLGGTAMLLSTFAVTAMPNSLHDIGSTICAGMGLLTVFGSKFVVSNQKRKIKSELENGLSKFLEIRGVKSLSELSDSQKVIKDYDVYLKHGTLFSDEEINDGKTVQDIINNYKEIFELRIKRIEEYTKANPSMLEKRLVATGISENNSALVALGLMGDEEKKEQLEKLKKEVETKIEIFIKDIGRRRELDPDLLYKEMMTDKNHKMYSEKICEKDTFGYCFSRAMNDLEKEQIQSRATDLTGVKMVDRIKNSVNAFKEKDNVQVKCVSLNKPNC